LIDIKGMLDKAFHSFGMTPASLMVRLLPGAANDAVLRLTADLAVRLKVTELIGIAACQPPVFYGGPDVYVPQDVIDRHRAQIDRELEACAKEFQGALEGKVTTIEWRSTVTFDSLADYIARELRAADLLVTSADEGGSLLDMSHRVGLADLVLKAGRPVLAAAAGADRVDLGSVAIAWKKTREARRALEDALPLLRLADAVTVMEIADSAELAEARSRAEDVADWLARHGIAAATRVIRAMGDDATQLSDAIADIGAGLVVGGAYGHARLREWALGGVTKNVLLRPTRCSLVSH
jgi:nucleotide-binding universal stress UspA family protein